MSKPLGVNKTPRQSRQLDRSSTYTYIYSTGSRASPAAPAMPAYTSVQNAAGLLRFPGSLLSCPAPSNGRIGPTSANRIFLRGQIRYMIPRLQPIRYDTPPTMGICLTLHRPSVTLSVQGVVIPNAYACIMCLARCHFVVTCLLASPVRPRSFRAPLACWAVTAKRAEQNCCS